MYSLPTTSTMNSPRSMSSPSLKTYIKPCPYEIMTSPRAKHRCHLLVNISKFVEIHSNCMLEFLYDRPGIQREDLATAFVMQDTLVEVHDYITDHEELDTRLLRNNKGWVNRDDQNVDRFVEFIEKTVKRCNNGKNEIATNLVKQHVYWMSGSVTPENFGWFDMNEGTAGYILSEDFLYMQRYEITTEC